LGISREFTLLRLTFLLQAQKKQEAVLADVNAEGNGGDMWPSDQEKEVSVNSTHL
jgi:hypothetical protein